MSDERRSINPDHSSLAATLESLPDVSGSFQWVTWTEEMDALLLKYWPVKRKIDVAEALGFSPNTCRARYRKLTREES